MKLKTKILFGLATLLLTAISLNLFYSYKIISDDKKIYIFENSLNQVEKLSNDIVGRVQNIIQNSNTFYYLAINAPRQLQNVIDEQDFILGFAYKEQNRDQVFIKSGTENRRPLEDYFQKSQADGADILGTYVVEGRKYLTISLSDNQIDLSYILDLTQLENLFEKFGIFNSLLLIGETQVLGPATTQDHLDRMLQRKETKVSYEYGHSLLGPILVSQARFDQLNLLIVSYASIEEAFDFLNRLIFNALFFGLIILGFSLIVGLVFSLQVTRPIHKLTQMALAITQGDYSQKVEIGTKDEIRLLGDGFNQMSSEISELLSQKEVMIKKLEDYGQNLEIMVDERTAQLKAANTFIEAMINSLDQGLFVIDRDLNCLPNFTKACENLFNKSPESLRFDQLLELTEKETGTLTKWADILFSEKIPFDSAKGLGPKEKIFSSGQDEFKHIDLNYFPMRNEQSAIDNIVVVATDKTNEVRALKQFEEKSAYVEMVLKLIRLKTQFLNFLKNSEKMLIELGDIVALDPIDFDRCLFIYHSLNGGLGSFSLRDMQLRARASEQLIVDGRSAGRSPQEMGPMVREDYHHFCELFEEQKKSVLSIFGSKTNVVEIELKAIQQLDKALSQGELSLAQEIYKDYFKRAPVREFFVGYAELLESISQKISKPMNPLEVIYGDLRVSKDHYEEFFSVLVHLFRNSMDHGIEKQNVRLEKGKEARGTMRVIAEVLRKNEQDYLVLEVTDDGAGIDPIIIRKVWNEKNPEDSIEHLDDDQVIHKIFDANFSTSQKLTDLSGRGVGMSSVKEVVDKLNGQIEVHSVVGKGTSFKFILPYF